MLKLLSEALENRSKLRIKPKIPVRAGFLRFRPLRVVQSILNREHIGSSKVVSVQEELQQISQQTPLGKLSAKIGYFPNPTNQKQYKPKRRIKNE